VRFAVAFSSHKTWKNQPSSSPLVQLGRLLSSLEPKVRDITGRIREHWSIENTVHWSLDMTFHEDASQITIGHGPANFGFLRRFVLSVLKLDTSKGSLRGKRKRAGWSTDLLEKLLGLR